MPVVNEARTEKYASKRCQEKVEYFLALFSELCWPQIGSVEDHPGNCSPEEWELRKRKISYFGSENYTLFLCLVYFAAGQSLQKSAHTSEK